MTIGPVGFAFMVVGFCFVAVAALIIVGNLIDLIVHAFRR